MTVLRVCPERSEALRLRDLLRAHGIHAVVSGAIAGGYTVEVAAGFRLRALEVLDTDGENCDARSE